MDKDEVAQAGALAAHPADGSGVIPHLTVLGGIAAIDFYTRAFGAVETVRMMADDNVRLLHAALRINGGCIFVNDDFPEYHGGTDGTPTHLKVTPVTIHLSVADVDGWMDRTAAAGAEITMPAADMFWGERYGRVRDPFGHVWSFGGPLKG